MKDKSKIIEFPNSLGKATTSYDEDDLYDFEWLEKPVVLRMSQAIVDTCYSQNRIFLRPLRRMGDLTSRVRTALFWPRSVRHARIGGNYGYS